MTDKYWSFVEVSEEELQNKPRAKSEEQNTWANWNVRSNELDPSDAKLKGIEIAPLEFPIRSPTAPRPIPSDLNLTICTQTPTHQDTINPHQSHHDHSYIPHSYQDMYYTEPDIQIPDTMYLAPTTPNSIPNATLSPEVESELQELFRKEQLIRQKMHGYDTLGSHIHDLDRV
jgi:hypothetical protein